MKVSLTLSPSPARSHRPDCAAGTQVLAGETGQPGDFDLPDLVWTQAWERLRVEWIKDVDTFCQTHIIKGSLSKNVCGHQGWLSWQPPGNLTLQLNHVSFDDSGRYVCGATVEIPDWEEAQGNGVKLLVETGMRAWGCGAGV